MSEPDQHLGVGLHRTTDVEKQHQTAVAIAGLGGEEVDRLATAPHCRPHRAAKVVGVAVVGAAAPSGAAHCRTHPELRHRLFGFAQLCLIEVAKVLLVETFSAAEPKDLGLLIASTIASGIVAVVGRELIHQLRDIVEPHREARRVVVKERKEHGVVHCNVFLLEHEGGPAGPVHVKPLAEPDGIERSPKEGRLTDRDRHAAPAQDVNEAGDQAVDVKISWGGGSHRRTGHALATAASRCFRPSRRTLS